MTSESRVVIAIHGGAWAIPDSRAEASRNGVREAAARGYRVLRRKGSAVDSVVEAVTSLEDDPAFDAGTGSCLTSAGTVEMDAVVMEGRHLSAGAVACVHHVTNPVQLARLVMEKTDHVMIVGAGADDFAREMGVDIKTTDELATEEAKRELEEYLQFKNAVSSEFVVRKPPAQSHSHETVGAVALDCHGNMAFATSTGGITAKRPGRVGDSPIMGSGGYCDNAAGGVSCTGHGEAISRVCLAHRITTLLAQGSGPEEAASKSLQYMAERLPNGGCGGAIVLTPDGRFGQSFTSRRMAWACAREGTLTHGLEPGEVCQETLD